MVDFAGEKEYYITHQTFLTANAVFLLTNSLLDEDVFSDTISDEGMYAAFLFSLKGAESITESLT